jgi:hypothetical protein
MFCFKEWLQADGIRTDFYETLLAVSILEDMAEQTARVIFEELDENDPGSWSNIDDQMRELKKQLKDSVLWIRWNAVLERQKDIAELRRMRDEHLAQNPQFAGEAEESDSRLGEAAGDDDFENLGTEFDVLEAIPLLEKTGYFNSQKFHGLNDEKFREAVRKALYAAAKEKGNDLPPDIDPEEIKQVLPDQRKSFFEALRKVFARTYGKIAASDRNRGSFTTAAGKRITGQKLFEDPEEVFTKFATLMYDMITRRNVSEKLGKAASWGPIAGEIGNIGKSELKNDTDKIVDRVVKYFGSTLKSMADKEEEAMRAAHSPSARLEDEITSRSEKRTLINKDIEGKKPGFGTKFYEDYLKSLGSPGRGENGEITTPVPPTPEAKTKEDKWRLEIIQHILFLQSRHSDKLSLDPNKIKETLENYKIQFLRAKRQGYSYLGLIRTKDSDSGEGDYDPVADDGKTRGEAGSQSFSNPAMAAASAEDDKSKIIQDLRSVLEELARTNPDGALAVCIKFGLNCSENGRVNSMAGFADIVTHMTASGTKGGEEKEGEECLSRMNAMGIQGTDSVKNIAIRMAKDKGMNHFFVPGQDAISPEQTKAFFSFQETIRLKLKNALKYICEQLPLHRLRRIQREKAASVTSGPTIKSNPAINTRFDASRQAPLSRFRKQV